MLHTGLFAQNQFNPNSNGNLTTDTTSSMNMRSITMVKVALVCLLGISSGTAQNLIVNGDFGAGHLTGWTTTPTAPISITYDGGFGNPSGSALVENNYFKHVKSPDQSQDRNPSYIAPAATSTTALRGILIPDS